MIRKAHVLLSVVLVAALAGCGGGSSSGGSGGSGTSAANPWIGDWTLISDSGGPVTGQMTLDATSFSETQNFEGGTCTWTGSVSNVTDTTLTKTTTTADGAPQCAIAIDQSASPTWMVSDDNNTLTLDYRGAISFGTLQVWSRN